MDECVIFFMLGVAVGYATLPLILRYGLKMRLVSKRILDIYREEMG